MSANLSDSWTRRRLRFDAVTNPVKSELTLAEDGVSFVPMEAVGELGGLRVDEERWLDDVYDGYTYFRDGDIVVAKITPCFENGKGAIAAGLINGVGFGTTELHVLRPGETLDGRFLFYLTIAHDFRCFGTAEMLGAGGQKRVPERFLKDWRPPLPSFALQRQIVAFLDEKTARIDALVKKKRSLLDRLAEKRRAVITQAVTKGLDSTKQMKASRNQWLGQVPNHWEIKRLRFLLEGDTLNGIYKPKDQFSEDGFPFIQMGEAFRASVFEGGTKDRVLGSPQELEQWSLKSGDFLIARRSIVFEGSGKSVLIGDVSEPHLFESSMIRLRPSNPSLSKFLSYYFQSDICRAFVLAVTKTVTISGIDSQQLKSIEVPVPPPSEAERISDYLSKKDAQLDFARARVERSINHLLEYRSTLITVAVTGRLPGFL